MIKLTIEGRDYSVPSDWSELTLDKFIEICDIKVPKKLATLYETSSALSEKDPEKLKLAQARYDQASSDITEWDLIRRFPAYYGRVIKTLGIPDSIVNRIHHEPRTAFFNQYLNYIVMSTFLETPVALNDELATIPYMPPEMETFTFNKKKYALPKSLHLMGEDIPLAARIAALADVYDALTTKRPYKGAMLHEKAVQIIREACGSQFDAAVVEAFVRQEAEFARLAAELADAPASSAGAGPLPMMATG